MEKNFLYHGTNKKGYKKLIRDGGLIYEYNDNDEHEIGLFVSSSISKARMHGDYIFEINLDYERHIELLEICRLNKNGDLDALVLIDDSNMDYLDECSDECFLRGGVYIRDVIAILSPNKEKGTTHYEVIDEEFNIKRGFEII